MILTLIVLLLLIPNGMTGYPGIPIIPKQCRFMPVSVGNSPLRSIFYYYDTRSGKCTKGIFKSFLKGYNMYRNMKSCREACVGYN